ncbi:MAG: 2-amino-4-hydroxy-6-hydroxymethyldihydropteridine diphosphokinase [Lachnospiraceae bacterium]|nr:2-amino-4-hydroxy-6-hydroxymethyldihydropteridine diphosphokinase [Lachnospiraceae bacterium]
MDQIRIKRLEVFANHGVLEEENKLGQKFLVSVTMGVNARIPGQSDELADSVNYAKVSELICQEAQGHTFRLIERLAEHLAERILLTFPQVQSVDLEIEKPWAPVRIPLETVSVTIHRRWHQVYLGIGSNLGEKQANLDRAVELLREHPYNRNLVVSQYIVTEPVGGVEQDDFLNGALGMETLQTPEELLAEIGEIEQDLKRVRQVHWGPRTIDVDILLYDEELLHTDTLTIPHPEMHKRNFVLQPLAEIAPYAVHPVYRHTVNELLEFVKKNT